MWNKPKILLSMQDLSVTYNPHNSTCFQGIKIQVLKWGSECHCKLCIFYVNLDLFAPFIHKTKLAKQATNHHMHMSSKKHIQTVVKILIKSSIMNHKHLSRVGIGLKQISFIS
jgi:hypothetical protein